MKEKILKMITCVLENYEETNEEWKNAFVSLKKLEKVCDALGNYPVFYKKVKSKIFMNRFKNRSFTEGHLEEMFLLMEKLELSNMKRETTPFQLTDEDKEVYALNQFEESQEAMQHLEELIHDLRYLLQLNEQKEDILDVQYEKYYHSILFSDNIENYEDGMIALIAKWADDYKTEYDTLKAKIKEEKISFSLLPLQGLEKGKYLPKNDKVFSFSEVKEKADYVRSIWKTDEAAAISLLKDDMLSVFTRICYEIEVELSILNMEEESLENNFMKEELMREKEEFSLKIQELLKEGRVYGKQ